MSLRHASVDTRVARCFITYRSRSRAPFANSGSAYALSPLPRRMGFFQSLLAHLHSSALNAFTPQGNPQPHHLHATLKFYPSQTGRLIVIGDVHGCAVELAELLVKIQYTQGRDQLVFVGDLVNKGPHSPQVIQIAMKTGARVVRGNHDDKALASYSKWRLHDVPLQGLPASEQWVEALKPDEAAFLRELPFTCTIPSHRLLIVHAGCIPNRPKLHQEWTHLYLLRNIAPIATASPSLSQDSIQYIPCGTTVGAPWASHWQGSDHIIFGHDAKRKLQQYQYATGLDTGCVYGGSLTACIMPIVPQAPLSDRLAAHAAPDSAPTLDDLRAELVSVPARQQYIAV